MKYPCFSLFTLFALLMVVAGYGLYPRASAASEYLDIGALTQQQQVVDYLIRHQHLPDFYLTKKQALQRGWKPARHNLCKVLPGYAIGGDRFFNRERQLPAGPGREWSEADVNYRCGRRTADRLLYSNDGLIYLTTDHYRSFKRMN